MEVRGVVGAERPLVRYSNRFKSRMVQRMLGPEGLSATALSKEMGITQSTLSRWLRQASEGKVPAMPKKKRPQDWTPEEKLSVVAEASALPDDELGAFLRRKGLHAAQLERWREAMFAAVSRPSRSRKASPEARRVRELEKELRRKDKALAEAAALLVLKKKARAIWGDEDDDTKPGRGR